MRRSVNPTCRPATECGRDRGERLFEKRPPTGAARTVAGVVLALVAPFLATPIVRGEDRELPAAYRPFDPTEMAQSSDCLVEVLPDIYRGREPMVRLLRDYVERWGDASVPALPEANTTDPAPPGTRQEIANLRRELLLGWEGMAEFLSAPAHHELVREWENEYVALRADLANRAVMARWASETFRPESLILPTDRDPTDIVLRRTEALWKDLTRTTPVSQQLMELGEGLAKLSAANQEVALDRAEARYALFANVCRVRRLIAFQNPLLNFHEILFCKRHRALYDHMCDQYYGMAATPGGGLYVLSNAFSSAPIERDVLADAVVENGRLKGQKLSGGSSTPPPWSFDGMGNLQGPQHQGGGSFLSPDLSYDGNTVLFAYVECQGDMQHRHHVDPSQGHWDEGRCYHIFRVNLDGSQLQQLTDGTWNDFDPCWLPNGRIAFISERRGGYLRCGRVCPTYTLFDMAADGSEIACLSFHETNEWHPSVTNDGMIVWTRWDYVDRHGCTAHMPWLTTLDGRDPRAVHGNFAPRPLRPDMELDCRAIPGSHKLVAIAAPHHGQAYGTLIIIDPSMSDDDAMAPVKRITPEVGFPESQGGPQVYGTPWPLSEDYHLCVYDASMRPGVGFQGGNYARGNYGIYLVDSFGNRELIYRDREIACLSPIPVFARPVPPVMPDLVRRGSDTNPAVRPTGSDPAKEAQATVAVLNVYDSLLPWPTDTSIRELRILQVFPMSVPSGSPPHDTGRRIASAGDSVVPVRHVLGTVPVEEDGSVYFAAPANIELFFQAVDAEGLAVQSMRSATQLHVGEQLVCAGCHDSRHRTPPVNSSRPPLALQRPPSRITPEVEGSNPFSYPRLVQPVLDQHCVDCHQQHADTALNLGREPITRNWYASYNSLIEKYAFYDYGDGYRTTPGRFGATASRLYQILQDGHYDVQLTKDEFHRLTLWLDCSSMFYGVYEQQGGQAQLRGEIAHPTLE